MKVKATIAFSGTVSMAKGDIKEIPKGAVLDDLLNAGYVEEVKDSDNEPEAKSDNGAKKSAAKRKGGGDIEAE